MPFLERNGIQLHYEILEGLVPADTLFLHGNLASNAWWRPAMEVWRANAKPNLKGRIILAEWRGCGKSSGPGLEKDLAPEVLSTDANALLDSLKIKKAHFVGHSTGGLIGLVAMSQRPELYAKAVLLDPVSHKGIQFPPEMFAAFTQMSQDRSFCELVMMGTIYQAQVGEELKEQLVSDAFGVHPLIWHGVPKALHATDVTSELPKVRQPVLVLHGEFDAVLPKNMSQELAGLLPNGRFYEIPGRGHSTNVEDPALFVKLTNEFLYG